MEAAVEASYRGRPITWPSTGGWASAIFIIGAEVGERFAYFGISSNLITYLTGPLGQPTASAAANMDAFFGLAAMLTLLGGFVADRHLGRYRMVVLASLLYLLGFGLLTISVGLPALHPLDCSQSEQERSLCPSPSDFQVIFFFTSLYLVAIAHGGHKPCMQAFGADQFDSQDPSESGSKSSFFNWWYLAVCVGKLTALLFLNYIQDNLGWILGFGIPCITMGVSLTLFLLGTKRYHYHVLENKGPFEKMTQSSVEVLRNRWDHLNSADDGAREEPLLNHNTQCEFSEDKAAVILVDPHLSYPSKQVEVDNDSDQMKEANGVWRLLPIWSTCLLYAVVFSQPPTLFTKQGSTLERHIGYDFQIPPAALQSFISITITLFLPIYDRVLVPIVRKFTGIPSGITMLQRIGIGMFCSVASLVVAALVEMKRLKTARDFGLVDKPTVAVPMSLWWLVPQYVLLGFSEALTVVGLQEFFYDQVPDNLRSLGLALFFSICGIGSFISSFLITIIDWASVAMGGGESWFSNNLNRAHLDYFYWLLAGLSTATLVAYLCFAQSYVYKKKAQ